MVKQHLSKVIIVSSLVLVLGGGFGISKSQAAMDWIGLEQKLEEQDSQLDNHEARITNTEEDVNDLQENTNTPPSDNKVSVPPATSISPDVEVEPTPAPEQVVVTSVSLLPTSPEGKTTCMWSYSDGSNSHFYTEDEPNKPCDASAIGLRKS